MSALLAVTLFLALAAGANLLLGRLDRPRPNGRPTSRVCTRCHEQSVERGDSSTGQFYRRVGHRLSPPHVPVMIEFALCPRCLLRAADPTFDIDDGGQP